MNKMIPLLPPTYHLLSQHDTPVLNSSFHRVVSLISLKSKSTISTPHHLSGTRLVEQRPTLHRLCVHRKH